MLSGASERLDSNVTSCIGVRWTDVVGLIAWLLGFALEVTADFQKYAFKQDPANKGRYIDTGAAHVLTEAPTCATAFSEPGHLLGASLGHATTCNLRK